MKLIVGLGNPGKKYIKTRHNIGFRVADELSEKLEVKNWELGIKFKALISEGIFNNEKILLVKPQSFMNLSGQAVKALSTYYKINSQNIWIIHDDIDLPLGTFKISQNISSAGHKGIQSIIDSLGTKDFVRFRVGIKPDIRYQVSDVRKLDTEIFVLEKFTKDEEKRISQVIKKTTEALVVALKDGVEKVMNEYNC